MEQEDLIKKDLTLSVLLPGGHEKMVTVHGSKPVMDVLVILCARYHLNPSDHAIELFSTNHNKLQCKPSSLIGSLDVKLVVMKPKRSDVKKAPNVPEATVRLIINYRKSHKAIVRVSPRVPLAELMTAVCEKCEMDPKSTVLLRDGQSEEPLDLMKTLNDYGIRDLYAKDCKKESRGILGMFKRSKKLAGEAPINIISTSACPVMKDQRAISTCCSEPKVEMPKKRRAPQPPSMPGHQSVSAELNSSQQAMLPNTTNEKRGMHSRISSTESSLKRNKRKAPPPPCTTPSLSDPGDKGDGEKDNSTKANLKQYSCSTTNRLFIPPSLLMTDVLSELTDRMKSMEQKIKFNQCVTHSPPALNHPPVSGPAGGDPVMPPSCELLRHCPQRDDLNTFTVVPEKRSTGQCEFLQIAENLTKSNGDTGGNWQTKISDCRKIQKVEISRVEMLEKADCFESIGKTNGELRTVKVFGEIHQSRNTEKHLTNEHPTQDTDEREDQDWIQEDRFLPDEVGKKAYSETLNAFGEDMFIPKPPPQPVCRTEEETETPNLEESSWKEQAEEVNTANGLTIQNPNPPRYDLQCDPAPDATYTPEPFRYVNISDLNSNSDATYTSDYQSSPQTPQDQSTMLRVLKSKLKPSCKLSPPNSASLFALAVSQRVQSLGNVCNPLSPSVRIIGSRTLPQSVSSQNTSTSQEFINKIPAPKGPWDKAPPTSTAPPFVIMTAQSWSSCSPAQMKNLEQE